MILAQHSAELRRDALRQKNRDARAEAEKLDVRNGAQPAEKMFQPFVAEQERVAAAQEHVPHLRVVADVLDLAVELGVKIVSARIAHEPRAGAVTAVGRATVRHQKQYAVGVAMHESGHRRMRILAARVAHFPRRGVHFLDAGNHLPADRTVFVRRVDQVEKVRRDGEGQFMVGQSGARVFLRRQRRHQPPELFERRDAVFELPAPVVPVSVRHVRPEAAPGGFEFFQ